jgi:hypothetical protein
MTNNELPRYHCIAREDYFGPPQVIATQSPYGDYYMVEDVDEAMRHLREEIKMYEALVFNLENSLDVLRGARP